jgi:hypothetical protein
LVGKKIKLFSHLRERARQKTWRAATVLAYDTTSGDHSIRFDDDIAKGGTGGGVVVINLTSAVFRVVGDGAEDGGGGASPLTRVPADAVMPSTTSEVISNTTAPITAPNTTAASAAAATITASASAAVVEGANAADVLDRMVVLPPMLTKSTFKQTCALNGVPYTSGRGHVRLIYFRFGKPSARNV